MAKHVANIDDSTERFLARTSEELNELAQQARGRSRFAIGIGLYLVKRIVELHEGTVHAHSAGPGLGSTFTVRLPTNL